MYEDWKPEYCRKEIEHCYCAEIKERLYEEMCSGCRDTRADNDKYDFCICGPK